MILLRDHDTLGLVALDKEGYGHCLLVLLWKHASLFETAMLRLSHDG
jgi:hypothetical protein